MGHTSEEVGAVRQVARSFTQRYLMPLEQRVMDRETARGSSNADLVEPAEEAELIAAVRSAGLWGVDVPEDLGGAGLGLLAKCIAVEELCRSITPFRLPPESPNMFHLAAVGTQEQRRRYLDPLCRGEKRSSIALTEASGGSDVAGIKTLAEREGHGWVIRGSKQWISWADKADFFIVIAITDREKRQRGGMTAFLVDADSPGVSLSNPILTMGEHRPFTVYFDGVRIGDDAVLGEVGEAFKPLTNRLGVRRIEIGARAVGHAERLIDMMCDYSVARETFGDVLASRQAIQFMIAESVMEVAAARQLVYDAAGKVDDCQQDVRTEASAAKVFATESLSRIVDRALQVHGAMGYSRELPIQYLYRSSRMLRLIDGTSEIHRIQLARIAIQARTGKRVDR